jgi:hypothetical protein
MKCRDEKDALTLCRKWYGTSGTSEIQNAKIPHNQGFDSQLVEICVKCCERDSECSALEVAGMQAYNFRCRTVLHRQ